ncbi:MAG TPA: NAD(P)-dependent oxidoreductase [Alphaproteobacteria bacterium]|nr:NAD(P)-dependent oxidoreductase [Alphaproteobacteria bacterium]
MRVLITGAGGFVGSRLAADLAGAGHEVIGIWHRNRARLPVTPADNLVLRQADLADANAVDGMFDAIKELDAIIHAAAIVATSRENSEYLRAVERANILTQANLFAAATDAGCKKFIFTSTIGVYGGRGAPEGGYSEASAAPTSYYGWSKYAAEQLLDAMAEDAGIVAVSLRLAGVHGIGRRSGALHAMARAALDGSAITVNEPGSRFRWAFIEDVSRAVATTLGLTLPAGHHIANLASADVFTLAELARRIAKAAGSGARIDLKQGAPTRSEVMNIETAERLLDFVPTALDVFLTSYLAGLRRA